MRDLGTRLIAKEWASGRRAIVLKHDCVAEGFATNKGTDTHASEKSST